MPAPSIDYLNARRAILPASGGTNYAAVDRVFDEKSRRAVTERARIKTLTDDESMQERLTLFWQDHHQFVRELRNWKAAGLSPEECSVPF